MLQDVFGIIIVLLATSVDISYEICPINDDVCPEITECLSDPCKNGATCIDERDQYSCICASGYDGTNCDNDINECANNPCQNGGTCNDLVNSYTCTCAPGFTSTHCEPYCDSTPSSAVTLGEATLSSGSTTYLSTAIVTCNIGYSSAVLTLTCQSNGSWSTAVCVKKDCGSIPPSAVTEGTSTLTTGSSTYLSTANVTCNTGYSSTVSTLTCQSSGTWSTAVCVKIDCGSIPLSAITEGVPVLTTGSTTYLSTASVVCNIGYSSPVSTLTCQSNWTWSTAVCLVKDCFALPTLTNGRVHFVDTTYQAEATYVCDEGYIITGTTSDTTNRTCQASGAWSDSTPTCSGKDCGSIPLSAVTEGVPVLTTGSTTYLSTASVTCNIGYSSTVSTLTCQSNGIWSTVVCVIKDCFAPPTVPNGQVDYIITTYQAVATYVCDEGYIIAGTTSDTTSRTCQASGAWSDSTPTCSGKDCNSVPLSAVTEGTTTLTTGSTTYLSTALVTCNTGYSSTTSHLTCQSNGSWSTAVCVIKDCGPVPTSAVTAGNALTPTSTTYLSTADVTCNTGYSTTKLLIDCLASGQWSHAECVIVDCHALANPANGQVNVGQTTYGEVATYTCNTGYDISGTSSRTCSASGVWSGGQPTCTAKDCGVVDTHTNGGVVYLDSTNYLDTATFTCDIGYDLSEISIRIRQCQADGTWESPFPTCIIKDCGVPESPANGSIDFTSGTHYLDSASFTCDTGYSLNGSSLRQCQSDGTWEQPFPTCEIKDCGEPPVPTNGSVNYTTGTSYLSFANFTCDTGFQLEGDNPRLCQADGTWESPIPTCELIDDDECCSGDTIAVRVVIIVVLLVVVGVILLLSC